MMSPRWLLGAALLVGCGSSPTSTPVPASPEATLSVDPAGLVDIDGNAYRTVTIGGQTWMAENLRVTRFADGTPLTFTTDPDTWRDAEPQFQWADTRDLNNIYDVELPQDFYGAMYNEAALASGRLAPDGWRLPDPADFLALRDHLRSSGFAGEVGAALKAEGAWLFGPSPLDAVGFSALPGGYVSAFGSATGAGSIATWATTQRKSVPMETRTVANVYGTPSLDLSDNSVLLGAPVRLIRDESPRVHRDAPREEEHPRP